MAETITYPAVPAGGIHVAWLLGDDPRSITTREGAQKTIIELRDPCRLSQSLVLWLDGPAETLPAVAPGSLIRLHLDSARSGKARGELLGYVPRDRVEAAFVVAAQEAQR